MYPWQAINPEKDSTLRMIHECAMRGHTVAITSSANLTIRDSITMSFCKVLKKEIKVSASIPSFYKSVKFNEQMLPLEGFDVIIMRDNPPLDKLALNFLDSVKDDVFIMNSVDGLRIANNKLYTATYHDPGNQLIPKTFVSKNKDYLSRIIKESEREKMIMKPLDGYGGSGVIVIEKKATQNISSLLDFYISGRDGDSNYVILQEYIEGAEKGDIRVLMLNGEPIGAYRRVPAEGDNRSNVSAGGSTQKHTLSKIEKKLCKSIGAKLVKDGLYFVGLDIIGDKLIEVNVMSPGGIVNINKLSKVKLQKLVVDYLEETVFSRKARADRKFMLRKTVNDA
jgi:glutathione synthase